MLHEKTSAQGPGPAQVHKCTSAQGLGPSLAVESPLIITPNPGGQTMATQILPVPTSPPRSFGPVPIFPSQPTKEPEPPTKGAPQKKASQREPALIVLQPPPGLEHVIEDKKEEDAWIQQFWDLLGLQCVF